MKSTHLLVPPLIIETDGIRHLVCGYEVTPEAYKDFKDDYDNVVSKSEQRRWDYVRCHKLFTQEEIDEICENKSKFGRMAWFINEQEVPHEDWSRLNSKIGEITGIGRFSSRPGWDGFEQEFILHDGSYLQQRLIRSSKSLRKPKP